MDIICPKGHHSTDPDYCSECGAKIDGAPSGLSATMATAVVAGAAAPSSSVGDQDVCPDCGTRRANPTALFCEVCRYNFSTRTSWSAPVVDAAPADPGAHSTGPVDAAASATSQAPVAGGFVGWDAVLSVDPSLYTEPDPNYTLPAGEPERTYPLDLAENLIGRRSDRLDIHPEINVNDAGVSHRHAKLLREPSGTFVLLDVGSANGTKLNGADVATGVRTPINDGDQITLGFWTRIAIHGRTS